MPRMEAFQTVDVQQEYWYCKDGNLGVSKHGRPKSSISRLHVGFHYGVLPSFRTELAGQCRHAAAGTKMPLAPLVPPRTDRILAETGRRTHYFQILEQAAGFVSPPVIKPGTENSCVEF